eukprot:scaffold18932_cov65-Phaeocystis_antarctica.AAC.7
MARAAELEAVDETKERLKLQIGWRDRYSWAGWCIVATGGACDRRHAACWARARRRTVHERGQLSTLACQRGEAANLRRDHSARGWQRTLHYATLLASKLAELQKALRVGRPQAVRLQTDGDSAATGRQREKVAERRAGDLAGGVGDAARRAHPPQHDDAVDLDGERGAAAREDGAADAVEAGVEHLDKRSVARPHKALRAGVEPFGVPWHTAGAGAMRRLARALEHIRGPQPAA